MPQKAIPSNDFRESDLAVHPQGAYQKDKLPALLECLKLFLGIDLLVVLTQLLGQLCVCRQVKWAGRGAGRGEGILGGM